MEIPRMTAVMVFLTPGMLLSSLTTPENSSRSWQAIHARQSLSPVTSNTAMTCGMAAILACTFTTSSATMLTMPMNSKPSFM